MTKTINAFSLINQFVYLGYEQKPELNYKLQLQRIHASTFGNTSFEKTREKNVNYEPKINKHEILCKSKNRNRSQQRTKSRNEQQQTSYFSEMKFKDSLGRCHSLPLENLFRNNNHQSNILTLSPSHLDDLLSNRISDQSENIEEINTMSVNTSTCNIKNETNNAIIAINSGKHPSKFDILLRNPSAERKKIMTNIMSPSHTSDAINNKKGRGYFYESVGGVYYSFGNSFSDDKSVSEDDNKNDVNGIENSLCHDSLNEEEVNEDQADSDTVVPNHSKWKNRTNLNALTASESSDKGDSGRQTCSSPISSNSQSNNTEDNLNNDKHIYAIARCAANVASLPGSCIFIFITRSEFS